MTTFSANNHEDLNIEIGQEEHDQQPPSFSQPVPIEDLLLKEEPQTTLAMDEAEPTVVEQLPMEEKGEVEHDLNGSVEIEEHLLGGVPSSSSFFNDENDNDITEESTDKSAIAMMAASAPQSSKTSPCQSRRTKLFIIGASIAVLAIVALSAGFGMNKNRSTTNNASFAAAAPSDEVEVDSAMMAAITAYPTYSPSTSSPTSSPTLPPAGKVSNDFELDVDSEADGAWRDRRLRMNKRGTVGGLRGSQQRNNRKLKRRK